jgi:hypothetical protein
MQELPDDRLGIRPAHSPNGTNPNWGGHVALMVVVFSGDAEGISIRRETAERLTHLGVTTVAVVGDADTTGVVLEGWAFDPETCSAQATAIVGAERRGQVLYPLMQMAISAGLDEGRE